jgi:hypothetical protein
VSGGSIHYILQAKPIACAVRGTCEICVKIPWTENVFETNLCMLSDDMQLFSRNEESVEQALKV